MRNISNIKYYRLKTNEKGYIDFANHRYFLEEDDVLLFPYSTDKKILITNYNILQNAITDKIIENESGNFYVSFNVSRNHNLTYKEWTTILEFAKKAKINFRVNSQEEYTPNEMENYINKFVIIEKDQKRMIYENETKFIKNNNLLDKRDLLKEYTKKYPNYPSFYTTGTMEEFNEYINYLMQTQKKEIVFEI